MDVKGAISLRQYKNNLFSFVICFLFCCNSIAQSLEGYWEGAIIRTSNSIQLVKLSVFIKSDSLYGAFEVNDWPYFENDTTKLAVEGNVVKMQTPYGKASFVLDTNFMELIGTIGQANPPLNIHLKQMVKDRNMMLREESIRVSNNGYTLNGTLYYPIVKDNKKLSTIMMIPGRGCSPEVAFSGLAKFYARQGLASFVYNERGSQNTGFGCEETTHELEVSDIIACIQFLKKHRMIDKNKVGVFSSSAGAWIADAASSETDVSFMIQHVGPATSVKEQQIDGLKAFASNGLFDEQFTKEAIEYTNLLFEEELSDQEYKRLVELKKSSVKNGWVNWLEDSDMIESKEEFKKLWVQRYRYDPSNALINFKGPFLSILGEKDFVVPYETQVNRFDSLFQISNKKNYEIKVIKNSGHGLEQGSKVVDLGYNPTLQTTTYYFKFYRAGVLPLMHSMQFLKKYGYVN